MAFKIYLDKTVVRIIDESGNNEPLYFNPGTTKYSVKKGAFTFLDGIEGLDFNRGSYADFVDEFGSGFASEADFTSYLNTFLNINATKGVNNPLAPLMVAQDEVNVDDVDWEASDFTGWQGTPQELMGNVNNGGIFNDSTDNPKTFTLRLVRTKQVRVFAIGSNVGTHSNLKAVVLGSGGSGRGVLDRSEDPTKRTSTAYSEEQFVFNAVRVEFHTSDRVDLSNLFLKNGFSDKRQNVVHKWGANPEIDSGQSEVVWALGGLYVFTTTPQPYYISSDSVNDTEEIEVETVGLNAEGRYQREKTTVTLQGQTKVLIPTTLDCVASNRAFAIGETAPEGNTYIYEDRAVVGGVPSDFAKVRAFIPVGKNQTRQAVYTVPEFLETGQQVQQFDIYSYSIEIARQKDVTGEGALIVIDKHGIPRERHAVGLGDKGASVKVFGLNTPLTIPPGSDIYLIAEDITANNTKVFGDFTGSLILL